MFSIASSSSGNCIYVGNEDTHILIDAGISGKRIEAGLNEYGLTLNDIDGVLVTHEHGDHIAGLGVIARKCAIPIFATKGTIEAIKSTKSVGKIEDSLFNEVIHDEMFELKSLSIKPIKTSHDAAEPAAYVVSCDNEGCKKKVAVCTDLGIYDNYIVDNLQGLDAILLEANHDVKMLQVGSYPYPLKQRILSEEGHLSNELSGQLLSEICHDNLKKVLLGHLSKENNYEDLAFQAVNLEVSLGENPYSGRDFDIEVAPKESVSNKIVV